MLIRNLTAALMCGLAGGAAAADLDERSAPMFARPAISWTGFYAGLNAGYGFGAQGSPVTSIGRLTYADPIFLAGSTAVGNALAAVGTNRLSPTPRGFTGGAQLGYNRQIGNSVVGFEADIMGFGGSKTATLTAVTPLVGFAESYTSTVSASKEINWLSTFRARVGAVLAPNLLIYATGGLAVGGVKLSTALSAQESLAGYAPIRTSSSSSDTPIGFAVGLGSEWKVSQNWSLRGEYMYYDLGTHSHATTWNQTLTAGGTYATVVDTSSTRSDGHIFRAGVNYHF